MNWESVITIITILAGSTGFFTLLQYLMTRKDKTKSQFEKIEKKLDDVDLAIKDLKAGQDRSEAIGARVRILRYSDELRHGQLKHSEEFFDQLNDDITFYKNYCATHPDFINNKAVHAIDYIDAVYRKALKDNDFA